MLSREVGRDRAYFEDLEVGLRFGGDSYAVEHEEMLAFARKWDPQAMHVDVEAGEQAGFDGIIASGAYTTAIFTLLATRSRLKAGDHAVIAVMAVRNRLPHPVRAGDELTYRAEVSSRRESKSRPDAGVVTTIATLTNQRDQIVFESESVTLVARRPQPER